MESKILGGLYGGLIGDAMGAAADSMSYRMIEKNYKGYVKDFYEPIKGSISYGRKAGMCTGAFSIFYTLLEEAVKEKNMNEEIALRGLLRWSEDEELLRRYGGLTTKNVIRTYKDREDVINYWDYSGRLGTKLFKSHFYALSSNGVVTKSLAAGFLHPGDMNKATETAISIAMSSHDDYYSIIAASSVAAALSHAFIDGATAQSVFEHAIKGGELAMKKMPENALHYPGPSVIKRMKMTRDIAISSGDKAYKNLADIIGSGPAVSETLPSALGIIIANQGRTMDSIYDAVNIGDESSKIAMICGCITGVMNGVSSFNKRDMELVSLANSFDLEKTAKELYSL